VSVSRDKVYGGYAVSLRPAGVGKWAGVTAYCAWRGIGSGRVLAIGDGENDLDLLAAAALAWVPADGAPAALALAGRVIPAAGEGGWAAVLELVR
jgi:hydroxymethylpyrimidine pyrophosphatase-like HAD family hydrolase